MDRREIELTPFTTSSTTLIITPQEDGNLRITTHTTPLTGCFSKEVMHAEKFHTYGFMKKLESELNNEGLDIARTDAHWKNQPIELTVKATEFNRDDVFQKVIETVEAMKTNKAVEKARKKSLGIRPFLQQTQQEPQLIR